MCAIINFEGFWETFHRDSVSSLTVIFLYHRWVMLCFTCKNNLCGGGSYVHQHQGEHSDVWWSGNLKQGPSSLICFLSKSLETNARRRFYTDVWNGTNGCLSKECVSRQIWLFIKALIKAEQFFFFPCVLDWVDTYVNNPNCFHNCLKGNIGDI